MSRHATTRAGDPQVHDHVLVANVVSMGDERGGWKGLDTAFVRDHLHAATAVGRMAAAARAVELGYGIEPDRGPSGRLGGFAISGMARQAWQIHATRSAQIDRAAGPDASYRARAVAARATRDRKAHEPVGDLVDRWRQELTAAGFAPARLESEIDRAAALYGRPDVSILDSLPSRLLGPDGELARRKSFTRADVIVAAAPLLHGLDVSILDTAVEGVLGHELAVPLPPVVGTVEPVWAAAGVIADEERIAALAETLAAHPGRRSESGPGARIDPAAAAAAVAGIEAERGVVLTGRQRQVAEGLLTSGRRLQVVVGVAGSGKTTTLAAVRAGFEAAGHPVVGAATSGQAALALGAGSGIESRTVASLTWRLDHGRQILGPGHVVILDEAGMTSDTDIGRLLGAVERAGAAVIIVGDYHQLDAVGPGGALEALCRRHPELVSTLADNLRQRDPLEREALQHLRGGDLARAVAWYEGHGRVHPAGDTRAAVHAMVAAWAADTEAGADSLLVAYRRANVATLNQAARHAWARRGRLSGPALRVDGREFQAGDRIVTLTPGPAGAWTTSQRATVTAVDPDRTALQAVTAHGTTVHITGEHLGADRVGYGYAITAHRSQGATVERAHVLADGGGRELAYVAMSRARADSHIHLVSPDPAQAGDRLTWAWQPEQRQAWNLQNDPTRAALSELRQERTQLARLVPADKSRQLGQARSSHSELTRHLDDLRAGRGPWTDHPAGRAARQLHAAQHDHHHARARARAEQPGLRWWARRRADQQLALAADRLHHARRQWEQHGEPIAEQYRRRIEHYSADLARLEHHQQLRRDYLDQHPDALERISRMDLAIRELEQTDRRHRFEQLRNRVLDRGQDVGLGL